MAEDATGGANPLLSGLPDEIVTWEILVRLDPKSVLRCRAVRRDWRRATSTRRFLLANHSRQPTLPIFDTGKFIDRVYYRIILTFDHRAANNTWRNKGLNLAARLDKDFRPVASCDGLLVLSKYNRPASGTCLSICNPATREHASLGPPWDFKLLGMYSHRPTGEYRLLLKRWSYMGWPDLPKDRIGFYVFVLGSNQQPRFIGWPEMTSWCIHEPVMVRDCLHWYPVHYLGEGPYQSESNPVIVFDMIAESFRQMHVPIVPTNSYIFEMDGTLGIQHHNSDTQVMDIWVLQNYEREIWDFKYHIKLPIAEICEFKGGDEPWDVDVVSRDGELLLLIGFGWCLLHIDSDGKLIDCSFHDYETLCMSKCQLKQSLVQHTFFPALEGYAVNTSPFV